MTGTKLHSIGLQALTVALLAFAVMAYLTAVISSPTPSEAGKPLPRSIARPVPPAPGDVAAGGGVLPDAPSSKTMPRSPAPWQVPDRLQDMAPFHGKQGDHRYDPIILRAARDYGIDPAVIKAVIMAESGFDPRAISSAGAQGLMQLMPRTANALNVKDPMDARDNILGGTRYLKHLIERFDGNLELALAAYNAGSRNVRRHNGIPPFKATRRYIAKIKRYHQFYRQQDFSFASRVIAAIPPELDRLTPLPVARAVAFFSSLYRAAV